ncbi:uncharacterized protein LOC113215428 [Frankliniella occidentalis]|uniref:Uncharacterized protein LOC113215428 n=1 Tax=Frankliniella occidentalis TaxID=133901 RepID=A0A6J1TC25_FRAOC|nr:uncharacterized protein LOC113215428 [Frankliniella occidentalis]
MSDSRASDSHNRRLAKERVLLMNNQINYIVTDLPDDLMDPIEIVISGPGDSPFAGGSFGLKLSLPDDYPFKPPRAHFTTSMWHPNISTLGSICVDILEPMYWSCGTTLLMVVEALRALLTMPNPHSPLNVDAASMMLSDPDMYEITVRSWTHVHGYGPDTIPQEYKDKIASVQEIRRCTRESALRKLSKSMWVVEASRHL